LSVIEFVRLAGSEITVLDMNPLRLDFCKKTMQVAHTVQFSGDGSEMQQLEAITGGARHSVVIDATGSPKSMCNAFNYVAHTGKLVFVGIVTDNITFPDPLLHRREMTVFASRNALPADFGRIIGLIEEGKIDTRPWITHRTPFGEMIGNFPSYTKPETGVVKALVEVD
jgi:alcohol dehydrogenase